MRMNVKRPEWSKRNFLTEVLIPSLFQKREERGRGDAPDFPKLKEGELAITWIGHASFLIQSSGMNILVDPNWANWLLVVKRLREAGMELHHLPEIDLVLITHAHFDHLHKPTLRAVAENQPIVVPRGVSSLVHRLGFERVHEMDWWDEWEWNGLRVVFTPAKHWGARVVADQHRKFGGYGLFLEGRRVYHCGDSAFFDGFTEIGERVKPEVALMPIGAYDNPSKRDHHMSPEQVVDAFKMLGADTLVPMHFGTYRLSYEPMDEPLERLERAAREAELERRVRVMTEGVPEVF